MREALRGLTTRGRAFLAAGVAAVVCAVVFGQRDVLRVGVLIASLPLISAAVVARTRYRLACTRRLEPGRTAAGTEARVILRLENVSRLPTGLLLVEDRVPYTLGPRPRFVLDRVEPRGAREIDYPVRSELRGEFELGPLTLRLADPFGMCELVRSFTQRDKLVVTPVVQTLPTIALGGEWAGSGESRSRSVAAAGEDDVATREYRHGDDLRRVHWRSTARHGEIMVRREEQPWESRSVVLLDTRARAHRGEGAASSFEWAVSAAASTSLHLARHGYTVDLVTDSGSDITRSGDDLGRSTEGLLLDALAVVGLSGGTSVRGAAQALRHVAGDGLLVAVLGAISANEASELARLRHGSTSAVAILIDTATWPGHERSAPGEPQNAAVVLRHAGWRVLPVRHGDSLPALWPWAARSSLVALGSWDERTSYRPAEHAPTQPVGSDGAA